MKMKMKSSSTTRGFSIVIMIFYGLYSLFNKSLLGLLLSFSIGLIFYGIKPNLEMAVAIILISGIVLSYVMKRTGIEGFEDADKKEAAEEKEEAEKETEKKAESTESEKKETSGSEDLKKKDKSGFVDINPAPVGQFKLGEIPKEEKGGFFIDQGTTLMNALNGLKPAQINAMTNDTKQLIETQKSLMGMLNTLAPMMKEGSSLLNMFNGMFGKGA
jgi:hypothetical protein